MSLAWFLQSWRGGGADRDRKAVSGVDLKPEVIRGGQAAPELFMKPMDPDDVAKTLRPGDLVPLAGWVQLKLDGLAAGMIDRRIVTSQGSPFKAALHCLPGLIRLEEAIGQPTMIVGEYVEEEGYDATMAAFKRGEGAGIFWVYDAVPLEDWRRNRCTAPIEKRIAILEAAMPKIDSPFVGLLNSIRMDEPVEVAKRTQEVWTLGYEGTVVKRPGSLYQRCRSPEWIRLKQVVTTDVIVADVLHKAGRLSMLVCRDPGRPMPPIKVATGWSDEQAAQIESLHAGIGPLWVEIAYNKKCGSEERRHARFVRIRSSKGALK